MERIIQTAVQGYPTQDGAGVSLVRVLGRSTVEKFDPILMLDSFDSHNPADYTAGFPMHPHRGIETISYLSKGRMSHQDSLGNRDTIGDGEVQWMTAGSGILHEEQLPSSERMLGVQLWLNLPAQDKMTAPAYHSIKQDEIAEIPFEGGVVRLLAGRWGDTEGYRSHYLPLDYYDIHLEEGGALSVPTDPARAVMLFTLRGEVLVGGERVAEKTAVKLTAGDFVQLKSGGAPAQVLFVSSLPLHEPVAWGGPIVMNTKEELQQAFADLDQGTFLRQAMRYEKHIVL